MLACNLSGYEYKKGPKGVGYYMTVLPKVTFDPKNPHKSQAKAAAAKEKASPGGYVRGPGGLQVRLWDTCHLASP